MIDPKSLRPIKASEITPGGVFYRKDEDGFRRCQLFLNEMQDVWTGPMLRILTTQYAKEGRLFTKINTPFQ